jgi:hypothetical protein
MAFTSLNINDLDIGDPIKRSIMTTIKDDLDDLDSRASQIEALSNRVMVFDSPVINVNKLTSITGLSIFRSSINFTLTDAKIVVYDINGISGTLQVDVKKLISPSLNTYSTVFTIKPSITFPTTVNYQESNNAVFDNSMKNIIIGDYLRLDITSLPSSIITKFHISIIGEV